MAKSVCKGTAVYADKEQQAGNRALLGIRFSSGPTDVVPIQLAITYQQLPEVQSSDSHPS